MKVFITSRDVKYLEEYDYRDFFRIEINGQKVLEVRDGDSEDANLSRDFNEVWNIESIIESAHEAGRNGQDLEIIGKEAKY